MGMLPPTFIVGIGGSAGGLNAYKALLDAMPFDTGMSFVILYHFVPTAISEMSLILTRHTRMPVSVAATAMPIRANHVYVCPPNTDLFIESNAFKAVSPRLKPNAVVDVFFKSLAEAKGEKAIGIIFSGYDGDGAVGCRYIKEKGGTVIAQDASAEVQSMPRSARATGCVDYVLSPEKIPGELKRLALHFKVKNK